MLNLEKVFAEFSRIANVSHVDDLSSYLQNTLDANRNILGAIKIHNVSALPEVLQVANAHKLSLYPISRGQNWGYGSSLPTTDGCCILDLSSLCRILDFNAELGYVTVEPGVTQQMLHDFLKEHDLPFMVPTTGGGPECSILGNALEKGFGITPHQDHFGAVMSLEAVLANGETYRSLLNEMGGSRIDPLFKWNLGPYLDGLFVQGNFGIVTRATITLARKPANCTQFISYVDDEHFEEAVRAIHNLRRDLGTMVGGINLMNKRRLMAMLDESQVWTPEQGSDFGLLPETEIRRLAKENKLPDWMILGGIYAPPGIDEQIKIRVDNELRYISKRTLFFSRRRIEMILKLMDTFKISFMKKTFLAIKNAVDILEGTPSRLALKLAYLKNKNKGSGFKLDHPDRENCGLIWFSPLLPMNSGLVRDYLQEVTRVCVSYKVEPLITLTSISDSCFDATIPLIFDKTSSVHRDRTRACYNELLVLCREFKVFPYRLDIETQRSLFDQNPTVSTKVLKQIKNAMDPQGIIAPGRYSGKNG